MKYANERRVAVDAVVRACGLCASVRKNLITADTMAKKDKSPVTVADYGVQALVTTDLIAAFPSIPMVGEEDARELRSSDKFELKNKVVAQVLAIKPELHEEHVLAAIDCGTFPGGPTGQHWALDPIDGTKGFLRGDQYAIALALIEDGEVVLGVLGCPNLPWSAADPKGPKGCVFVAVKGQGAYVRPIDQGNGAKRVKETPIHVSDTSDPGQATFCESVESEHTSQGDSAKVAQILGVTRPPFRIDSQCKYAAIARGDSTIYLRMPTRQDYEEKIWDHAAGWLVVKEAGGEVTDIHGKPLDFSLGRTLKENKGVVATNGKLHKRVVGAIGQALS
jgi:3'(2'), 5'-bisphosphate nucleotidase